MHKLNNSRRGCKKKIRTLTSVKVLMFELSRKGVATQTLREARRLPNVFEAVCQVFVVFLCLLVVTRVC